MVLIKQYKKIIVKSGDGGSGSRMTEVRGGCGGNGGSVYLIRGDNDNYWYQLKNNYCADSGYSSKNKKNGANASDLTINIPRSTNILVLPHRLSLDLTYSAPKILVAEGGKGGRGLKCPKYLKIENDSFKGRVGEKVQIIIEYIKPFDILVIGDNLARDFFKLLVDHYDSRFTNDDTTIFGVIKNDFTKARDTIVAYYYNIDIEALRSVNLNKTTVFYVSQNLDESYTNYLLKSCYKLILISEQDSNGSVLKFSSIDFNSKLLIECKNYYYEFITDLVVTLFQNTS